MGVTSESFSWKHYFQRIWLTSTLPLFATLLIGFLLLNQDARVEIKALIGIMLFVGVSVTSMIDYWRCEERHSSLSTKFGSAYYDALDAKLREKSFEALIFGRWLELLAEMRKIEKGK